MNNHIATALKTWYPKDHPLHLDLEPSLMGLAGEVAEVLQLHKKVKFKPNFELTKEMELEELGDAWYYLRVVAYQTDCEFRKFNPLMPNQVDTSELVIFLYQDAASLLDALYQPSYRLKSNHSQHAPIRDMYDNLLIRLSQLNTALDELTELNWQKLSKREDEKIGYGFKHA